MVLSAARKTALLIPIVLYLPFAQIAAVFPQQTGPPDELEHLTVSPNHIEVTSFYHGSTIHVEIVAPAENELALKLEGLPISAIFNKKGKWGFLWMNVGEVTVKNAPAVYMLYTSADLSKLASRETLLHLSLGYRAFEEQIEFEGDNIDRKSMLQKFNEFNERRGLYRLSYGSLHPDGRNNNYEHYSIDLVLPSVIPVGVYELDAYLFKEEKLTKQLNETITIEKAGLPLVISNLASEHGADYGLVAIIVAVFAGFIIGAIFSRLHKKSR